jgi:hypothetical protein
MPVAVARVKPLSPVVIHDGAAFYHAGLGGICLRRTPNLAERGVRTVFKFYWFTSGIFLVMLAGR